jgi:dihydrofolate reductase
MIISCIVATARKRVIGKDNAMPWHLPADLAYFKKTTLGHPIILGRKNFEAIGRPLPGRANIIITKDRSFACSNCTITYSIEEAIAEAKKIDQEEIFIIGGGSIYEQSMPYWQKLYLTEIELDTEGDVFFPTINMENWDLLSEDCFQKDEKNPYNYCFKVFERIKN